ncbi:unnamed protein product [Dibothriocephalus latus]|uniref:Uncharacterized protein n=1 Tax=Dibothriocephalus latus TaxID=60516 RepID=A0A3P7LLG7_DIBLA|nr:unnamed protein product [Dibothriocephalus latus]
MEKSPWMNVECLNAKNAKQAFFDKWKANPCQATANAWKAACDKLREELLKLRQFWIEQIHSVDYFQEYEDIPLTDADTVPSSDLRFRTP